MECRQCRLKTAERNSRVVKSEIDIEPYDDNDPDIQLIDKILAGGRDSQQSKAQASDLDRSNSVSRIRHLKTLKQSNAERNAFPRQRIKKQSISTERTARRTVHKPLAKIRHVKARSLKKNEDSGMMLPSLNSEVIEIPRVKRMPCADSEVHSIDEFKQVNDIKIESTKKQIDKVQFRQVANGLN